MANLSKALFSSLEQSSTQLEKATEGWIREFQAYFCDAKLAGAQNLARYREPFYHLTFCIILVSLPRVEVTQVQEFNMKG